MTNKFIILCGRYRFFFFLIVLPWFGHVFSNKGRFGHKRKLPGFFYFLKCLLAELWALKAQLDPKLFPQEMQVKSSLRWSVSCWWINPLLLTNWARQIGQEIGGSSSACGTPTGTTNAIRTTYEPKIFSIHFWIIDLLSLFICVLEKTFIYVIMSLYMFHSVCLYFLFVYFDFF